MKRNLINIFLGLLVISSCGPKNDTSTSTSTQPNIIIILADDLGYVDVGFNGSTDIRTPNIDRIAANGVTFTNGYVSYTVCGPSRAGLITGRYQDRFGFSRNPLFAPKDIDQGVPLSEEMLSEALAKVGYRNMAIGKWHLGAHEHLRPLQRGFHEFFGFLSGGHRYFPEEWIYEDISEVRAQYDPYQTKLLRNNERVEESDYLTDALSREAVEFVQRSKDQPFFLYLAYNAPHGPLQATQEYLDRYPEIEDEDRRTYAAMVSALDDGVGDLLDELENQGIAENTLVFFLSDNGGRESVGANNGALRAGKGSLFEGGIRVPFAMQWKGQIPAGISYNEPIISLDIFATAMAVADGVPRNELDGVNLIPFLNGDSTSSPHEFLFWRKFDNAVQAVRGGDLKLVNESGEFELYNLSDDLSEEQPLTDSLNLRRLAEMHRYWDSQNIDPVFLGLLQDKEYWALNPDRFENVQPY